MTNLQQYYQLKSKHPDTLLLFRCGDFYECYKEDARDASEVLGITITASKVYGSLAGFPHHALDIYLPKLIRAGHRVAICDQLDDQRRKALVKRGATETVKADDKPTAMETCKVELPELTMWQQDLLCECIRYRAADNQKERMEAAKRGLSAVYYDTLGEKLEELKQLIYDIN